MVFWEDLLYFPLGICAGLVAKFIVMGPAHRNNRSAVGSRDPLAPPPFGGEGNPMVWARRVQKWVRAHEALCKQSDKRGFPATLRGYVLSEALYGTAFRTVESTLSDDVINSEEGVDAIVNLLAKFDPTTAAHEIFTAYKGLMQIRRGSKESFKLYVNRFEAAASELRSLAGQDQHGEAEQLLAFQLLEGAQIPTAVFLQVLTNCLHSPAERADERKTESAEDETDDSPPSYKSEAQTVLQRMNGEVEAIQGLQSDGLTKELEKLDKMKAERIIKIFEVAMQKIAESFTKVHTDLSAIVDSITSPSPKPLPTPPKSSPAVVTIDIEGAKKALRGLDAVSLESSFGTSQYERTGDRAEIQRIVRQTLLPQQTGSTSRSAPHGRNGKRKEK